MCEQKTTPPFNQDFDKLLQDGVISRYSTVNTGLMRETFSFEESEQTDQHVPDISPALRCMAGLGWILNLDLGSWCVED
jgi:hypothetical protein